MTSTNQNQEKGHNNAHYDDKTRHEHRNRNHINVTSENSKHEKFSPGESPDYNAEDFNTD